MQSDSEGTIKGTDYGVWPEIAGVVAASGLLWFLIYFSTGIM